MPDSTGCADSFQDQVIFIDCGTQDASIFELLGPGDFFLLYKEVKQLSAFIVRRLLRMIVSLLDIDVAGGSLGNFNTAWRRVAQLDGE